MSDKDVGAILIDVVDTNSEAFEADWLERAGHKVMVCHGPGEGQCPLIDGSGCDLVDDANGIVFHLDLDNPKHRQILSRYQAVVRPEVPINVVTTPEMEARFAEILTGVKVWTHEPSAGELDALSSEVAATRV
jgi:hypothetical protein